MGKYYAQQCLKDLPTPQEMARRLMASMPEDQAHAVAAELYQPIKEILHNLAFDSSKLWTDPPPSQPEPGASDG